MKLRLAGMAAITAAALATPAVAHHSFAMYDANKTVASQGTVQEFEWANPHSYLRVMVNDGTGKQQLWTLELGSPSQLIATGIHANSMRRGDVVSVSFHPMKDGSRKGLLVQGAVAR
jgi:hypothetical protein